MHISSTCPSCETTYQLDDAMLGKKIRCPNSMCREIFTVQDDHAPAKPTPETNATEEESNASESVQPQSGKVGDMVPLVTGELDASAVTTDDIPDSVIADLWDDRQEEDQPANVESKDEPPSQPDWATPPPVRRSNTEKQEKTVEEKKTETIAPIDQVTTQEPAKTPQQDFPKKTVPPIATEKGNERVSDVSSVTPATSEEKSSEPKEFGPDSWLAPPVRQGKQETMSEEAVDTATATEEFSNGLDLTMPIVTDLPDVGSSSTSARMRTWLMIAAMLALLIGGASAGYWAVLSGLADVEKARRQQAYQLYEQRQYAEAAIAFYNMEQEFPDSEHRPEYQFMSKLAYARDPVHMTHTSSEEAIQALNGLLSFVENNQKAKWFDSIKSDIWVSMQKSADEMIDFASRGEDQELLFLAQKTLQDAQSYPPPEGLNQEDRKKEVASAIEQVQGQLAAKRTKLELLDSLRLIAAQPIGNVVQQTRLLVEPYRQKNPDVLQDAEVKKLIAEMPTLHRDSIRYRRVHTDAFSEQDQSNHKSLWLSEREFPGIALELTNDDPIAVQSRGVLYALSSRDGKVLWARRIGLDVATLPIELPADAVYPTRWLVLSSSDGCLRMVNAQNGENFWQQKLDGFCAGKPILWQDRVLVALLDGRVLELHVHSGTIVGQYDLGQTLTGWGVLIPQTNQICVVANDDCIFRLDLAKQTCLDIIYSGHANGTVLGPPLFVQRENADGYLALAEADGLRAMKLQCFAISMSNEQGPLKRFSKTVRGWSWYPPWQNERELALISDAGEFLVYGKDPRLTGSDFLFTKWQEQFVTPRDTSEALKQGQVVLIDQEDYWIVFAGKFFHLKGMVDAREGAKLGFPQPLASNLGQLEQPAILKQTHDKDRVFFLNTRKENLHQSLVQAIRPGQPQFPWQTELGFLGKGVLEVLGDQLLVQDDNGTILTLNRSHSLKSDSTWVDQHQLVSSKLASAYGFGRTVPSPWPDRKLFVSTDATQPRKVCLRQLQVEEGKISASEKSFLLQRPFLGTSAASKNALLLPQENGILQRFNIADERLTDGPNWRAEHADTDSPGHVVWWKDNDFFYTDGSRGLRRVRWGTEDLWSQEDQLELPRRIAAPPVLIRSAEKPELDQLVVVDADHVVRLLDANRLRSTREWTMPGQVTAGPFVRGAYVGCVVDDRKLVWLDPKQSSIAWIHLSRAGIVGRPEIMDGEVIVACDDGTITFLDQETGVTHREILRLPSTSAATTAPVAWNEETIVATLTDGTLVFMPKPAQKPMNDEK